MYLQSPRSSHRGLRAYCAIGLALLIGLPVGVAAQESCPTITPEAWTPRGVPGARSAADPFTDVRVHRISNLGLTLTNYGLLAGILELPGDPCTRLPAPAMEFPAGTGMMGLHGGGLWVGAVVDRDTLVSVSTAHWPNYLHEMFPGPFPDGRIEERTTRQRLEAPQGSRCEDIPWHPEAISEHDVIAVYYDTVRSVDLVPHDPDDGRRHRPLGLKITQSSYSWSLPYAQDFVLIDYAITNIGGRLLRDVYVALYMDQDMRHRSNYIPPHDDLVGFLHTVPSALVPGEQDEVNTVWVADNDGDPVGGRFGRESNTSVTGVRLLRQPEAGTGVYFNWFVRGGFDWGPVRQGSEVEFLRDGIGAPYGDRARYQLMSNGEFDYDLVEAALPHEVDGWLPPHTSRADDIADGAQPHYVLSAGPFDLWPDSTRALTVAIVAGEHLHTDPNHFAAFWNPLAPAPFLERLDFTDFARNAQWADWVFDTPGFDTDGDGYRGEFRLVGDEPVYYRGDGIPDFSGPPAPPAPEDLRFITAPGVVKLRWNGKTSETTRDPFTNRRDFEGYRVYMSRTGLASDFAMLSQRDRVNYSRHRWHEASQRWLTPDPPFSLDSLKQLYDGLSDSLHRRPFHPDDFAQPHKERALREVRFDPEEPSVLDTLYYYFSPFGANLAVDDVGLADIARQGADLRATIRRLHPLAPPDSLAQRDNGSWYAPYYEYEYALGGLQQAEPVYFAVTVFDHGNPGVGLAPLETSPGINAEQVWPLRSAAAVHTERPKPGVYPNPYRIVDGYNAAAWEDPRREGLDPERARKVTFTNVPETCAVSIYSLDGDLVRRLEHRAHPTSSDATVVVWNLITRNTQSVKTGIYIWAVESRHGVDVGKLVIIK